MTAATTIRELVLIVDGNLSRATSLHTACVDAGSRTVVARDLPTALLMISQHVFAAAIISSRIGEEGDGWSLAAVFRMVFPRAYVAVLAREKNVLSLQAAINNGADELLDETRTPAEVAATVLQAIGNNPQETSGSVQ